MRTAIIILALLVAACSQGATTDQTVKIGVIMPLTGDAASLGTAIVASAQMAADELNSEGGINGKQIELLVEDGQCDGRSAVTAANKLIHVEGIRYMVGAGCSAETLAIAPILEQSGTVAISPVSSAPAVTHAGDYVFRNYPSDSFAGSLLAEYLYSQGYRKPALLTCINDYCEGLAEVFREKFESYEGTSIIAAEEFNNEARDMRGQITKIRDANPDSVVFLAYTEAAIVGFKQIDELGLDTPLFGTDTYDDPTIIAEAGSSAEGMEYMIPYTPENAEFQERFRAASGDTPKAGTPQGYDAVMLFAKVMRDGATTPEEVKDAFYSMEPYEGVSGMIAFDENGDLRSSTYLVKQYRNGMRVPIGILEEGRFVPAE